MQNPKTESFKPLTISAEKLPASMAEQADKMDYAAERASLLLGCYRTGDANDPATYVTAIAATLARYPESVITAVTDPRIGLPRKKTWLPSIKEVYDACEEEDRPAREEAVRQAQIKAMLDDRKEPPRDPRPTLEQLKVKYGENWGLTSLGNVKTPDEKAEENAKAMEREQARVRAEYEHLGMKVPSKLALSPAMLRLMAEKDEERAA